MIQNDSKIIHDVRNFKKDYYENLDVDRLVRRLEYISGRLERLKDSKKLNAEVFDLYYHYLQTLETLFINAYSLRRKEIDFPAAIFIDNANLKKFIESEFLKKTKYSDWFLNNYVLSIHEDKGDEKIKQYQSLCVECAKDYIDNYQLLNAYKHGARVQASSGEAYMTVSLPGGKRHKIADGDSSIRYYSKESDRKTGEKVIYEQDLIFKRDRVIGKSLFAITLLQNTRLIALRTIGIGVDKPKKYMYFQYDKDKWRETFGGYSWKSGLFSVGKVKK